MANYVVWIDHDHAKLFELNPAKVDESTLHATEIRHHGGVEKEQNNHKNSAKFFDEVAAKLASANEILLIGPGLAKTHFKSHLETHHEKQIKQKIVGMETVDHPTNGQIVALAKKFFKAHLTLAV
jgi:stalled ribosome rescue protein Dom34